MRILFFGTPQFVIPVLGALEQQGWLAGVATAPDKKVGRKQILTPSPVKQWALERKIQVLTPEKLDKNFNSQLSILNCQLLIVAAYGKIIPKEILDIPRYGALNIHPSLLPKYRGPSPIQAAILNGPASPDESGASRGGDETSGVTIIKMDEKMDHGPIVAQKEIGLSDRETFESLAPKMFNEGAQLLVKIIPDYINGKIMPTEQIHDQATFCPMITKESGYFDLDNPPAPKKLDRMTRAYHPWPGVWTRWNGKIIKFYPQSVIQIEGKKPVSLQNFINGYPEAKPHLSKLFPNL